MPSEGCVSKATSQRHALPWLRGGPRVLETDSASFTLEHTLTSGQSFRWHREGHRFAGVVSGHLLWLEQEGNCVLYRSLPGKFRPSELRTYLGLDGVHAAALRSFPRDSLLLQAVRRFGGMRLLRQDPWETLISFIISSNNNITRTRSCIESLCQTSGREIKPGCGFYSFPSPEALACARLTTLREKCNLGYRHTYVKETAREISRCPNLLADIARLPYPQARKEIMELSGVGPKVADCVLLYSMAKFEAFPIDTWIRRVLQDHYVSGERVSLSKLTAFARDHFGPFAGYAQLYLFHYALTTGA